MAEKYTYSVRKSGSADYKSGFSSQFSIKLRKEYPKSVQQTRDQSRANPPIGLKMSNKLLSSLQASLLNAPVHAKGTTHLQCS